jgi:enoyl-CoA hydratase
VDWVTLERSFPHLAIVTLNRPEVRTALYRLSAEAQVRIMLTEDFKEGPRAFIEKRPARWLGR